MNTISQTMKNLPEVEFPPQLHEKIMQSVYMKKLTIVFGAIILSLAISFFFTGWLIITKMNEANIFSMFQSFMDGFEMTSDYFTEFIDTMLQYLPLNLIMIFILHAISMGFIVYLTNKLKRIFTPPHHV